MLNATGIAVRERVAAQLDTLPAECLMDGCQASPDLDSPVPLCTDHGHAVFVSYLARTPDRLASVQQVRTTRSPSGWVYFIRRGDAIKIGWTGDVDRRANELHADAVLHAEPGTMQDERRMHAAFDHLLIPEMGREWFRAEPDLVSFVLRLKTQAA